MSRLVNELVRVVAAAVVVAAPDSNQNHNAQLELRVYASPVARLSVLTLWRVHLQESCF